MADTTVGLIMASASGDTGEEPDVVDVEVNRASRSCSDRGLSFVVSVTGTGTGTVSGTGAAAVARRGDVGDSTGGAVVVFVVVGVAGVV